MAGAEEIVSLLLAAAATAREHPIQALMNVTLDAGQRPPELSDPPNAEVGALPEAADRTLSACELPVAEQSSRAGAVTGVGVTQAPRCRSRCGCSPAKKQARISRIQANGRGRLNDDQHVTLCGRRLPHRPGEPGIRCRRAEIQPSG
jgi:hypothetical protein